jgi:hypothetical protein
MAASSSSRSPRRASAARVEADAQLAQPREVVLDAACGDERAIGDGEDVDLVDVLEAPPGRGDAEPLAGVSPEHAKWPTTVSPSATSDTIFIVKSGNDARKGLIERRASRASCPVAISSSASRSRRFTTSSTSRLTSSLLSSVDIPSY